MVYEQQEGERGRLRTDRPFSDEEAAAQDAANRKLLEETRTLAASRSKRS